MVFCVQTPPFRLGRPDSSDGDIVEIGATPAETAEIARDVIRLASPGSSPILDRQGRKQLWVRSCATLFLVRQHSVLLTQLRWRSLLG